MIPGDMEAEYLSVFLGSVFEPRRSECEVDLSFSNETVIGCLVPQGFGTNNYFTVDVGGQQVVSDFSYTYPDGPSISGVWGCDLSDQSDQTSDASNNSTMMTMN